MARSKSKKYGQHKGNWRLQIQEIAADSTRTVAGDRRASHATQEKRFRDVTLTFTDLHTAGFKFDHVDSIEPRHVKKVIEIWESRGVSPVTIANRMTSLRVFCTTIGKPHVMQEVRPMLADPGHYARATAARLDKSYSAAGVDLKPIIEKIKIDCPHSAMMLKVGSAYGLRLKEMVSFRPNAILGEGASSIVVSNAVGGKLPSLVKFLTSARLYLTKGTKGGRFRQIPVDTEEKREALRQAQAMARGIDGHIGRPGKTLTQNYDHLRYMCAKHGMTLSRLGFTPHALRHQFANDSYERLLEIASPVRGGDGELTPEMRVARHALVEAMGHSRDSVLSAYCGTKVGLKKVREASAHQQIDRVLEHLPAIQAVLAQNECEGLFLVGGRACGANTKLTPWEFITFPTGEPGRSLRAAEYAMGEILGNTCIMHAMDETPGPLRAAFFKNMWMILEK